jgi:hypothetical protein
MTQRARPNESQIVKLRLTALGLLLTTCFGCAAFVTGQVVTNVNSMVLFAIGFSLILFFSGGCEHILAISTGRRHRELSASKRASLPSFGQAFFLAVAGAVLFTGTCWQKFNDDNARVTTLSAFLFGASALTGVFGYALMWIRALAMRDTTSADNESSRDSGA